MTHQTKQRDRKVFAPIAFALFILAMGVAAWLLVLNPNKVAEQAPEKGRPATQSR